MADTFTAVLSLTKPEVGASADTWGTKLNDNFDDVDGLFQSGPALKVANGGTAATTAAGARTNLGLGTMATQDASSVAITGGTATLTGASGVSSATPSFELSETDAGTDEKVWQFVVASGDFYLAAVNDARGSQTNPIVVARTGTTVDSIALAATTVTINGNAAWHAGTFAAPSSGTFTVYLRATNDGADLASGTATWKKFNGVVTVVFPALTTTNTTNTLVLDGLPAAIQSAYGATQDFIVRGLNDAGLALLAVRVFSGTDYFSLTLYDGAGFASSANSKGFNTPFTLTYIV